MKTYPKTHQATVIIILTLLVATIFLATVQPALAVVWGSDTQLTTSTTSWDVGPSVMQTRDGTFWVAYASEKIQYQFDIFCKKSFDNGVSWPIEVRLTQTLSMDDEPSMMQTNNETIWLVWSSDREGGNREIFYQISFDNGFTWEPIVQLTNDSREDRQPCVMQNLNGTIWIVWHRVIAFGNFDIYYKTTSDYGLSWSDEVCVVTDPTWDLCPSIAHTENGTVFLVWVSYRMGNYELFYKTYNGTSWSSDNRLTTNSEADLAPSILQDGGGTIWVFWETDRGGNYDVYYKTSSNYGASWSADTSLVTSSGEDEYPSAVFSNNRKILVVFESSRTGDYEIWYKTSDPIPDVHDIALTRLLPWITGGIGPVTCVPRGTHLYINVTVENQGTFNEQFNVTVYADKDIGNVHIDIETKSVSLASGAKTTLIFTWITNTTPYGNYYLSATATIHPLEYDVADNILHRAAFIGGIAVPWLQPKVNVLALLSPLLLAALFTAAIGIVAVAFFKLLMSIRIRCPWRRSTAQHKKSLLKKTGILPSTINPSLEPLEQRG